MSTFYIVDSTQQKGGKNPVLLFSNTDALVGHLEGMCFRKFKATRKNFMNEVESLGFGPDDSSGRSFFEQMEQYFNMGVIRKDSVPVKCNIFEAERFQKYKGVHGD